MFAKVEYDGFDGRPDLRALAEEGTRLLAEETGPEWHGRTSVAWAAAPGGSELTLTVRLALPAATGVGVQRIPAVDALAPPHPYWLVFRVNRAWMLASSDYLNQRHPFIMEPILDTAEV